MKREDDTANLIPATWRDVIRVYCLKNERQARMNSFDTKRISFVKHVLWYRKFMHSPDIYIFFLKIKNRKVGYVRLNIKNEKGRISYCIDRRYRDRKYGTLIITMIEKKAVGLVKQLEAEVKKDNVASNRIFGRLNYEKYEDESCFRYVKNIAQ